MNLSSPTNDNAPQSAAHDANHNFHGASIINEQGQEIPITEPMIQQAFNTLLTSPYS